jgi:flagellar basal-body rod protein FlgG
MSSMTEDMTQGSMKTTDVPTDLALEGNALFEIALDDQGNHAWTRDGSFKLSIAENDSSYGYLTTNQGHMVLDTAGNPIAIPNGYHMKIDATGFVTVAMPDGSDPMDIGHIKVVEPKQPHLLKQIDNNMYVLPDGTAATAANTIIGNVDLTNPANASKGIAVRQGVLEQSNVNLADEMVDLMQVQRAYQLTARALTSSDTMMGLANNLRG